MDPESDDFSLSGPKHLTAVDWTIMDHKRSVAASLVKGVYVVENDRRQTREGSQALASPWGEFFNFQMLDQLKDDVDSSICGAIYEFKPPASHSELSTDGCPRYVIAFRGSIFEPDSIARDLELGFNIILNKLQFKSRFENAMQDVRSKVDSVGSSSVWLAGHSLGSAIALLAGKTMAKDGILLESFLFNLPYPSVPIEKIIKDKKAKLVVRGAGNVLRGGLALAKKKISGDPLKAWTPCLFLNQADHLCSGYVEYFKDKKTMEKFGLGWIPGLATQLSLRGQFMGNESEPMHRIPSANLTVNLTPSPDFKQAHGIHQWWKPDLHLESMLY